MDQQVHDVTNLDELDVVKSFKFRGVKYSIKPFTDTLFDTYFKYQTEISDIEGIAEEAKADLTKAPAPLPDDVESAQWEKEKEPPEPEEEVDIRKVHTNTMKILDIQNRMIAEFVQAEGDATSKLEVGTVATWPNRVKTAIINMIREQSQTGMEEEAEKKS